MAGTSFETGASGTSDRRPIALDLFSGAGGLSLGFEQAGFDVVAAVEYDPVHAATHMFNFPKSSVMCRDLSKVAGAELAELVMSAVQDHPQQTDWDGQLDALIGGPPCQGFSAGGKRDSADDRNQLILQFVRVVEELQPKSLCLENVAGLLDSPFKAVREQVFSRLRDVGYNLVGTEAAVDAFNFAVPQTRRRVIVLGALGTDPAALVESGSRIDVAAALEGLPDPDGYAELLGSDWTELSDLDIARRLAAAGDYARALSGLVRVPEDLSYPRAWDARMLTGSRRTIHTPATIARFMATEPGTAEPKSRLFRLRPERPARTLRAGSGTERGSHTSPRPIHPVSSRVITVREAARLHGYPDWFRFHTTNWHGHRQVGNSVPPPLGRAAAERLVSALGLHPRIPEAIWELGDAELLTLSGSQAAERLKAKADERPQPRRRAA